MMIKNVPFLMREIDNIILIIEEVNNCSTTKIKKKNTFKCKYIN